MDERGDDTVKDYRVRPGWDRGWGNEWDLWTEALDRVWAELHRDLPSRPAREEGELHVRQEAAAKRLSKACIAAEAEVRRQLPPDARPTEVVRPESIDTDKLVAQRPRATKSKRRAPETQPTLKIIKR